MSKILYIDDELDGIKIINLFGKYLTESEESELTTALQSDIPTILANNIYLQAEYDFVKVLELLENDFEKFNFFIIDRNLKGNNEHPVYDVDAAEKMTLPNRRIEPEREGDYIFIVLLEKYCKYSNPAILFDNFFFLTAYKDTELAYKDTFFKTESIIDKSNIPENFIEKINKFEDLVIKSEHREVFEVFDKGYLPLAYEPDLIQLLKAINQPITSKKANWLILRQMFEDGMKAVREVLIEKKHITNDKFIKKGGNLDFNSLLYFLNGSPDKDNGYKLKGTDYFAHCNFLFNQCYQNIIFNKFWDACSEVVHGGVTLYRDKKYYSSKYTLPILTNILMDFLLWYGDFMDKYSKPTP